MHGRGCRSKIRSTCANPCHDGVWQSQLFLRQRDIIFSRIKGRTPKEAWILHLGSSIFHNVPTLKSFSHAGGWFRERRQQSLTWMTYFSNLKYLYDLLLRVEFSSDSLFR